MPLTFSVVFNRLTVVHTHLNIPFIVAEGAAEQSHSSNMVGISVHREAKADSPSVSQGKCIQVHIGKLSSIMKVPS